MLGLSVPPVVCKRVHVLLRMLGLSVPPVVCRRGYIACLAIILMSIHLYELNITVKYYQGQIYIIVVLI
jgi:hypothetical protein